MALIDLTRQAQASSTGLQVLRTASVTSSITGLYDVIWDTFTMEDIAAGSLDAGSTGGVSGQDLYLYDESTGGNLYTTGSYGTKLVLQLNPDGYMTGSLKIYGDLIVEGSQSVQNVSTLAAEDPIIDLNFSGSDALASVDAGLRVGRDGGTNAMVVPCNSSFSATLGYDSFLRHRKQARDLGLESRIYSSTGLSLDIDIREDLETFNHLKPGFLHAMIGEYKAPPFM